ncbi:hypothetical protein SM0020_14389, partial [Sinorhizobium meliloti CCNWSX0020]
MIFASGVGDEGGSSLPLTLTLSPRAGRGDEYDAAASPLRPACGEKAAG